MIEFKVKPDNSEPYEVTATARDVLRWEKTNRGKTFKQLMETTPMVDLYQVAHIASRRLGLFAGDLREFEETCELEFEESEEVDPTNPAPSATS